jgi:DNA-3-methyladenine glycosylase
MCKGDKLTKNFFIRDVLEVAPEIIGKQLVMRYSDNSLRRFMITEVEAYRGPEDMACHASKGRTVRTEIMFHSGGKLYVYFIYGMYWMLNIVTGVKNMPQAVLIRGIEGYNGPGKLTKKLGIDKSFYGEDLTISDRIWIEDTGFIPEYKTGPRIGINYAGDYWKEVPWRYYIVSPLPPSSRWSGTGSSPGRDVVFKY